METYFNKFPTMLYSNTLCLDITRRVRLDEETRNALTLYYSYEIKDGLRADIISNAYYKDPTLDWLIWLTNDIVDPYTQWNLSEKDFGDYIIKKYGSYEASLEKVLFYRNNWYDDDNLLTPDFYDNVLDPDWKKYYSPNYGPNVKIINWKRKEADWVMETNEVWKGVCNTETFAEGDLIIMGQTSASPGIIVDTTTFNGEIESIDTGNNTLYIKNVAYTTNAETLDTIQLAAKTNDQVPIANVELVYRAIPLSEAVFWSPVYANDIENENNIYNRSIRILDSGYVSDTLAKIREKLQE